VCNACFIDDDRQPASCVYHIQDNNFVGGVLDSVRKVHRGFSQSPVSLPTTSQSVRKTFRDSFVASCLEILGAYSMPHSQLPSPHWAVMKYLPGGQQVIVTATQWLNTI
jgi:hypothetical protein